MPHENTVGGVFSEDDDVTALDNKEDRRKTRKDWIGC